MWWVVLYAIVFAQELPVHLYVYAFIALVDRLKLVISVPQRNTYQHLYFILFTHFTLEFYFGILLPPKSFTNQLAKPNANRPTNQRKLEYFGLF